MSLLFKIINNLMLTKEDLFKNFKFIFARAKSVYLGTNLVWCLFWPSMTGRWRRGLWRGTASWTTTTGWTPLRRRRPSAVRACRAARAAARGAAASWASTCGSLQASLARFGLLLGAAQHSRRAVLRCAMARVVMRRTLRLAPEQCRPKFVPTVRALLSDSPSDTHARSTQAGEEARAVSRP